MLVQQILSEARKRLVTVRADALLIEAATALASPNAELVVVCDGAGMVVGVIAKADIVRHIRECRGAACRAAAASTMTATVVSCRTDEPLADVWDKMKRHRLRHIPVVDERSRPLGVVNARDALQGLLTTAANEIDLLREYVMSVGYR